MKWVKVDSDGVADLKCKEGDLCPEPAWEIVMYEDGTVYFQCRGCADQVEMRDAFERIRRRPMPQQIDPKERERMLSLLIEAEQASGVVSDNSSAEDLVTSGFEGYDSYSDREMLEFALEMGAESCGAVSKNGYHCTLLEKHVGNHIATGKYGLMSIAEEWQ